MNINVNITYADTLTLINYTFLDRFGPELQNLRNGRPSNTLSCTPET